jgi:hypothetical protein
MSRGASADLSAATRLTLRVTMITEKLNACSNSERRTGATRPKGIAFFPNPERALA